MYNKHYSVSDFFFLHLFAIIQEDLFYYVCKGSVLIKVLESGVNCGLMVALVFNLIPDYKERLGRGNSLAHLNFHITPPPVIGSSHFI